MKKTKIERRIENAFDAFFADEDLSENKLEPFRNAVNLRHERKFEDSAQKHGTLETILKQVFFFFPGTFILYGLGMAFLPLISAIFTTRHKTDIFFDGLILFCLLLAGTLMTWLGLGNIRNPKHLVIPASIFSVGVLWSVIVVVLSAIFEYFGTRLFYKNDFLIYFFPLALTVPFLAKGWADRDS